MLFNSFEFLLFLPIVFLLYWFVFSKKLSWQNLLILAASYFFYGWWSWKFLLLLMLSTLLDYLYGFGVASANKRKSKLFLWLSIINNLGILGIFKYYNFFAAEFEHGFDMVGLHFDPVFIQVALPVGISFYTFHGLSYVFDIYRGLRKPVNNLLDYAVFVCFFPLLVAGPIERANHLLPQVQSKRKFNYTQAIEGSRLLLWGMFKKVVIADSLSRNVDDIFKNYQHHNALTLIIGAIAFSFQIYCDFSGYSDIAIGTAKLLGFELLSNFKFPYFSRDIAEFWRRWHISLTSWFRDYLYIPLGGSKMGRLITVRNVFIIFLVSGFWHGANWTFIIWGGIHACGFLPLLLMNKNRKHVNEIVASNKKLPNLKELAQMMLTFAFVTLAWIFFRMHTLADALNYVKRIVFNSVQQTGQFWLRPKDLAVLYYIIPFILIEWHFRKDERALNFGRNKLVTVLMYTILGLLVFFYFGKKESFIYFQF